MIIKNRRDQTEGATWKKDRDRGGCGKENEDDERKRGGRHVYGDEKGDIKVRQMQREKCLFLPVRVLV